MCMYFRSLQFIISSSSHILLYCKAIIIIMYETILKRISHTHTYVCASTHTHMHTGMHIRVCACTPFVCVHLFINTGGLCAHTGMADTQSLNEVLLEKVDVESCSCVSLMRLSSSLKSRVYHHPLYRLYVSIYVYGG